MELKNGTDQPYQHTIKEELIISGVGIHTGQAVSMRLKPAEPNTGINFQRVDLPERPVIKADVDNVIETNRSNQDARARTQEPGRKSQDSVRRLLNKEFWL